MRVLAWIVPSVIAILATLVVWLALAQWDAHVAQQRQRDADHQALTDVLRLLHAAQHP